MEPGVEAKVGVKVAVGTGVGERVIVGVGMGVRGVEVVVKVGEYMGVREGV